LFFGAEISEVELVTEISRQRPDAEGVSRLGAVEKEGLSGTVVGNRHKKERVLIYPESRSRATAKDPWTGRFMFAKRDGVGWHGSPPSALLAAGNTGKSHAFSQISASFEL
jgi:hypothetical protein